MRPGNLPGSLILRLFSGATERRQRLGWRGVGTKRRCAWTAVHCKSKSQTISKIHGCMTDKWCAHRNVVIFRKTQKKWAKFCSCNYGWSYIPFWNLLALTNDQKYVNKVTIYYWSVIYSSWLQACAYALSDLYTVTHLCGFSWWPSEPFLLVNKKNLRVYTGFFTRSLSIP
jgi:hypothetical protein